MEHKQTLSPTHFPNKESSSNASKGEIATPNSPQVVVATQRFKAFHLAERLKLSSVRKLFVHEPTKSSGTELLYTLDNETYFIIYNFGSVVFYNIPLEKEKELLNRITSGISPVTFERSVEDFKVQKGKVLEVDFEKVVLPKITLERLSIIGLVLAQSVALEYFENVVDIVLAKSGSISDNLEHHGRVKQSTHKMIKFIGFCINTKQKILSSTYLLDMPAPTWTDPFLEKLYIEMSNQFELKDRYKTIEHKLKFIQDTLEILSQLSYSKRTFLLELAIVALIVVEIILVIYELIHKFVG